MVGSRDGATFDGHTPADEQRSFQRPISSTLVTTAAQRCGVDGWCANWSAALHDPIGIDLLLGTPLRYRCVVTSGYGKPELLERLIPCIDAWVLLIADDDVPGPVCEPILQFGKHVEVVIGCSGQPHQALLNLPWQEAAAAHLQPRRPHAAVGVELQQWEQDMCRSLPPSLPVYHSQHSTTFCPQCGAELVWRHGGRSRIDQWDEERGICRSCGHPSSIRSAKFRDTTS
ncbi:MAG: hypothetical protein EA401_08520 [Planctomycetota bacterium]|nr:MAG: hypothetical protein EA401_08520 [Planctomycetota bacterium]